MNWGDLLSRKFLYMVVGPTLGLICGYAYFYLASNADPALGIAIGVGVAMIFHVGSTSFMIEHSFHKVSEEILKTKEEFSDEREKDLVSRMRVRRVDSDSLQFFLQAALDNADTIKNTFINISNIYREDNDAHSLVISSYNDFLNKSIKNRWYDATTYQDFFSGRFASISPHRAHGKHSVFICDASCQIMNFIIFEKNDQPLELYFGWISKRESRPEIFQTKEPELLGLFSQHFDNLMDQSIESFELDYTKNPFSENSVAGRIVGTWVSISPISSIKQAEQFELYSIINVIPTPGGWDLSINIFSVKGDRLHSKVSANRVSFHGDHISFDGEREKIKNQFKSKTSGALFADPENSGRLKGRYNGSDGKTHTLVAARVAQHQKDARELYFSDLKETIQELVDEYRE